jgi:hypothetical protein
MTRWQRGEATITGLLASRDRQAVTGAMTDGQAWLDRAARTLTTATHIAADDPESALILAYDAARQIGTGLLAQQGLRPTTQGGHLTVVRAVVDQFDGPFTALDRLRRRRNELQYPSCPGDLIDPDEVFAAITAVHTLHEAATKLLPALGLFT